MTAAVKQSISCADPDDGSEHFEALYRTHAPQVRRIVRGMLPSSSEVDDVVQEVFLAAYQGLGQLADEGALRAWLRTVAIRRCMKVIRRRYTCQEDLCGMHFTKEPATNSAHESFMQDLYFALRELPVELRQPWVSLRIEGLCFDRVAEVTSLSLSTVKRRIREADTRLRRRVEPVSSLSPAALLQH